MKDTNWALSLLDQIAAQGIDRGGELQPRISDFKPDEVFALKMASALFDGHYAKVGIESICQATALGPDWNRSIPTPSVWCWPRDANSCCKPRTNSR